LDAALSEHLDIGLAVVAGVGAHHRVGAEQPLQGLQHRDEQLLLIAHTVRLRRDDDLMFLIDCGHCGIALYHSFVRGHLGRLVIRTIALSHAVPRSAAILWMVLEPAFNLLSLTREPLELTRFALIDSLVCAIALVAAAVALDDLAYLHLHLLRLAHEIGAGTASGFRCIAGQLDSVDGEHPPADETLLLTHREHLRKHRGDGIAQGSHEVGDGSEVRMTVARDRHEHHVLAARHLDVAAVNDALAVSQQHDLEQHRRWVGRCADLVVSKARFECRQAEVLDQVTKSEFETTRKDLTG